MESEQIFISNQPSLTTNECRKIAEMKLKYNDFKIINHKLIELDSRNGFLGEHRRVLITVKRNDGQLIELHCFAKFLPENPAQIEFSINCGVFKKEVFVYDKLFKEIENQGIDYIKQVVPECYYTQENKMLIFEDVGKKGYLPLSKYKYFDYDHVLVTIKSVAKMHAASLIYEEKMSQKLRKTYRLLDDYEDYFYETFYVDDLTHKGGQGVNAALKGIYTGFTLYPEENYNIADEKFYKNVKKACTDIYHLVKPSKKYRNCICHGDLWATNIMIKYDKNKKPIDCLLLDFQTIRYCPPAHDFMSVVYLTTTRKFRKEYLGQMQQIYYDELTMLMKQHGYDLTKILPYEEFLQSCKEQKNFAIVQVVTYVQLTQAKDGWINEYIKNTELWNEALYEDRSRMVKENCQCDPQYREVFGEALKDMSEMCDTN